MAGDVRLYVDIEGSSLGLTKATTEARKALQDLRRDIRPLDSAMVGLTTSTRKAREEIKQQATSAGSLKRANDSLTLATRRLRDQLIEEAKASATVTRELKKKAEMTRLTRDAQRELADTALATSRALKSEADSARDAARGLSEKKHESESTTRSQEELAAAAGLAAHEMENEAEKARNAALALALKGRESEKARRQQAAYSASIGQTTRELERNERQMLRSRGVLASNLRSQPLFAAALISGVTAFAPLTSLVGDLSGGLVGLGSALTPVIGSLDLIPGAVTAAAQGLFALKLGFDGIDKVLNTRGKAHENALAKLTVPARDFAVTLEKQVMPAINTLKLQTQAGLFPGAEAGLKALLADLKPLEDVMWATSNAIGSFAREAGQLFGSSAWQRDIRSIGVENAHVMTIFGGAFLNVADAMRNILAVSGPFFTSFANGVRNMTISIDDFFATQRASGGLANFLQGTLTTLQQLKDIGGNVFESIFGLGRASNPLGQFLLGGIKDFTSQLSSAINSAGGQNALRNFFVSAEEPLRAVMGLVKDLAINLGQIAAGGQNELTQLATVLDQNVLPLLRTLIDNITSLLPSVLSALGDIANLAKAVTTGLQPWLSPVKAVLTTLGGIADLLTRITNLLPRVARLPFALAVGGAVIASWKALRAAIVTAESAIALAPGVASFSAGGIVAGEAAAGGGGARTAAAGGVIDESLLSKIGGEAAQTNISGIATGALMGLVGGNAVMQAKSAREAARAIAAERQLSLFQVPQNELSNESLFLQKFGGNEGARYGISGGSLTGPANKLEALTARLDTSLRAVAKVAVPIAIAIAGMAGLDAAIKKHGGFLAKAGAFYGGVANTVTLGQPGMFPTIAGALLTRNPAVAAITAPFSNAAKIGTDQNNTVQSLDVLYRNILGSKNPTQVKALLHGSGGRLTPLDVVLSETSKLSPEVKDSLTKEYSAAKKYMHDLVTKDKATRSDISLGLRLIIGDKNIKNAFKGLSANDATSVVKSYKSLRGQILTEMKGLSPDLQRTMATTAVAMAKQLEEQGNVPKGTASRLAKDISDRFAVVGNLTARNAELAFQKLTNTLPGMADAMNVAFAAALNDIGSQIGQASKQLGAKNLHWNIIKAKAEGATGPVLKNIIQGRATGGFIGSPGERGKDDQLTVLGRGEAVLTGHDQAYVNAGLQSIGFERGLHDLFGGPRRKHYMATGGFVDFNGHPSNVKPPVRNLIGLMEKRFPALAVTSTTDHSLHSTTGGISYHSSGSAVDMASTPGVMDRAVSWIKGSGLARQLAEGIHNPGLSVKFGKTVAPAFWGAAWPQHKNHIHMAILSALGALGGGSIPGVKIAGGGALPGLANAGLHQITALANQMLSGVGGGDMTGAGLSHGKYGKGALERLWTSAGGSSQMARLMAAIALAESGGNPNAHNASGATGLWQILGSVVPGNLYDPLVNARNAVKKLKTQGLGAWTTYSSGAYKQYMATGGFVGGSAYAPIASAATLPTLPPTGGGGIGSPPSVNVGNATQPLPGHTKSGAKKKSKHARRRVVTVNTPGRPRPHAVPKHIPTAGKKFHVPGWVKSALQASGLIKLDVTPDENKLTHHQSMLTNIDGEIGLRHDAQTVSMPVSQALSEGRIDTGFVAKYGLDPEFDSVEVANTLGAIPDGAHIGTDYFGGIKEHVASLDAQLGWDSKIATVYSDEQRKANLVRVKAYAELNILKAIWITNAAKYKRLKERRKKLVKSPPKNAAEQIYALNQDVNDEVSYRQKLGELPDGQRYSRDAKAKAIHASENREKHYKKLISDLKAHKPSIKGAARDTRDANLRLYRTLGSEMTGIATVNNAISGNVDSKWDKSNGLAGDVNTALTSSESLLRSLRDDLSPALDRTVRGTEQEKASWLGTSVNYGRPVGQGETDTQLAAATEALLQTALRQLAINSAQFGVLGGGLGLTGQRLIGAFAHGGPINETGMALLHRGEYVVPAMDGPFKPHVTATSGPVSVQIDLHHHDGQISGGAARIGDKQVQLTSERLGKRSRLIAAAPGYRGRR